MSSRVHDDIWTPPPTWSVCPVIHRLSGLASSAMTPLISSGYPGRFSGLQSPSALSICSSVILSPPGMYLAAASATLESRENRRLRNELTVHVRFDSTWCDAIDGDISRSKIVGETSHHALDSRLGSRVDAVTWNTLPSPSFVNTDQFNIVRARTF